MEQRQEAILLDHPELADFPERYEKKGLNYNEHFYKAIDQAEYETGLKRPLAWQIVGIVAELLESYLEERQKGKELTFLGKIGLALSKVARFLNITLQGNNNRK